MRVKLDENITSAAAALLRTFGHDADTVADEQLVGARDEGLARTCRDEGRLLVTCDVGFGDVRSYPPGSHAGVVVLRLGPTGSPWLRAEGPRTRHRQSFGATVLDLAQSGQNRGDEDR